nr:retrovirus-related Pol polyprotein from transposon TNT 1-94 [Tanacetum cinerariifolium]
LFIVMVQIDSYLGGTFLYYVCSHDGFHYYLCFGGVLSLAMMVLLRLCIYEYAITTSCWNANVVLNLDLGGAAWHHACNSVVFDGKDNRENIIKSIDEGPFKMGRFRETLAKGAEGALHLGQERDRVFTDLTPEEKVRVGNANPGQARTIKCYNCNGIGHIARQFTHLKRPQNSKHFKEKMLLMQAQENGVVLDEEQLLFIAGGQANMFDDDVDEAPVQDLALNEDHIFQADQCDVFDSNVDEAPTAQTMFMANLSSVDQIYDEVGPSYDSDILFEYVKNNAEHVLQSNVSSVPNDVLIMIINDVHEHAVQCVYANEQNKVVNVSLIAKLARYKELVEAYEKRARFELTETEQKIDEQMRIIIIDHNIKEESLKKKLHSIKMQLNSTIDYNKSTKEEVATLKKDFKQK